MKSKIFSISKAEAVELLPIFLFCALLVGASTLGSSLGYLAGIGIAYVPGINAIFAVILSMLIALLLSPLAILCGTPDGL